MTEALWDRRIARAGELSDKYPAASTLLLFYRELARLQKNIYQQLRSSDNHDVSVLLPHFPGLIALVKKSGSPLLQKTAGALDGAASERLLALLDAVWQHEVESEQIASEHVFFASALLQPYAEFLAEKAGPAEDYSASVCPFCGSKPHVAALRPEGDGGKRWLVCSLCATEWNISRLLCPNCGEKDKERLPVFIAEEFDYVRVDACDTCRTYIKSIDLTKNGNAIPTVDEIATLPLNLWAEENNYQKFGPNLFGM